MQGNPHLFEVLMINKKNASPDEVTPIEVLLTTRQEAKSIRVEEVNSMDSKFMLLDSLATPPHNLNRSSIQPNNSSIIKVTEHSDSY